MPTMTETATDLLLCNRPHNETDLIRCSWGKDHGRSAEGALHWNDALQIWWIEDERRVFEVSGYLDQLLVERYRGVQQVEVAAMFMEQMFSRFLRDTGSPAAMDWTTFRVSDVVENDFCRHKITMTAREARLAIPH
jgi:hypothetical protein